VIRTVKRAALVAGVLAAAVAAIGGYSLGATAAAKPIATACVTAKHVPVTLWAGSHRCPKRQHAITWQPSSPSAPKFITVESNAAPEPINGGWVTWTFTAQCPAGYVVTGGGWTESTNLNAQPTPGQPEESSNALTILGSQPEANGKGWSVTFASDNPMPAMANAYAVCES
jgi:hypothetical protein